MDKQQAQLQTLPSNGTREVVLYFRHGKLSTKYARRSDGLSHEKTVVWRLNNRNEWCLDPFPKIVNGLAFFFLHFNIMSNFLPSLCRGAQLCSELNALSSKGSGRWNGLCLATDICYKLKKDAIQVNKTLTQGFVCLFLLFFIT